VARVDRRTKNITRRLNPGEIAIIDHSDLDRVIAEELIRRKVAGSSPCCFLPLSASWPGTSARSGIPSQTG
jgi:uncharacterized membrane-anchored protein